MERHKCKEQTIGSGFMKWNAWTAATSITQTALMLKRENAQIARVEGRNLNKYNIWRYNHLLGLTTLSNARMVCNN